MSVENRTQAEKASSRGYTLIDVLEPENLAQAWKRVKANKGSPGIDGMTVEDFPAFWREHGPRIADALMEGTYRPASVRRVWIAKPDGSKRPLGVPTVRVHYRSFQRRLGIRSDHPSLSPAQRPEFSGPEATTLRRNRDGDPAQFAGR